MTRKHFEAIAQSILDARIYPERSFTYAETTENAIDRVSVYVADALEQFNNRFDRDRFLEACGCDVTSTKP